MNILALRLWGYLRATHTALGVSCDSFDALIDASKDAELFALGSAGVAAFLGDYVYMAWPPDAKHVAVRAALRVLSDRLDSHGFVLHAVYPLNARSVVATRRLGAVPIGVDADGFVHYKLTRDGFRYGKAKSTKTTGLTADH